MFDINSIVQADTAEVALVHPVTGALLGASVTVMGPEHPKRKALRFTLQRRMRAQFAKDGRAILPDPEEQEPENIKLLAQCTLGWKGLAEDGAEVVFSEAAAVALYSRPEMAWLREQVAAALDARENFIKGSGSP